MPFDRRFRRRGMRDQISECRHGDDADARTGSVPRLATC